ncbi:MAG: hypothetical protein GKS05_12265 [Nitrospirales bacterium]|nr:hypothetical protein [Nitrospirales bacterium]
MNNPSATIWNRIEARPRSLEIDRALRSEIRDPLWMLTRQWQFGELLGQDAGSIISVKARYRLAYLDTLVLGANKPEAYDSHVPLEANVEKERTTLDLNLRLEMGRHWLRLLRHRIPLEQVETVIEGFKANTLLHFRAPRDLDPQERYENAQLICKESFSQMIQAVAHGRMIDGGFLYLYLKESDNHFASDFLAQRDDEVDRVGLKFIRWFERVYGQRDMDKRAWHPSHLEYQFACTTPSVGGQPKVLQAKEYHGGHLDWYSVDYANQSQSMPSASPSKKAAPSQIQTGATEVIPTAVTYPGMPSARFWELEDRTVNLGNIQAFTTDTAKMIFAQFGLLYSNDWLSFSLELPLGCLAQINEIVVADIFGQRTIVPHVHERKRDEFWGLFQLHDLSFDQGHQNDSWLFVPPVVTRVQQSQPIEKVVLIRDEMANMVWAIENTISDGVRGGTDGFEHAQRVKRLMQSLAPQEEERDSIENEADVKYMLASTVPENWIPFIPVKKETTESTSRDIQLQRAAMPRIVPGFAPRRIRPHTSILKEGDFNTPYYVYEEEIPRSGAIINTKWKRTRWHDGSIVVWLGREKTNGRGEKSSGLKFDFLDQKS